MKKIKTIIALMVAFAALGVFADDSAPFFLNTAKGTRIAKKTEFISYSTEWDNGSSVRVTADGATLKEAVAPASGDVAWDGAKASLGLHTLTHVSGGKTLTAQFTVLGDDVAVHSGVLKSSEIWDTNKVHLVTGVITVPSGVSLTINSGAVVKFMPGMSLTVVSGGSCTASGAIFTHVNDDTIGGDTLMDEDSTEPKMGEYTITGNVIDNDATEYRYSPPQTLTSNISSDTRLRGYRTYIVSNSVTVASGAKLTLQPGTVLKFNSGCSLTVNGTLDAKGTRAAPIIFTSLKDDEHGGDTNGDGDKTYAQPGDWHQITGSGTVSLNYCQVLWCSQQNNQGGLYPQGGNWTFDNSIIAHCEYDCMRSYGGTFTARNSIFSDSSMGVAPSSGTCKFINCIFYDLTTAVRWGAGSYYNCIFSKIYQDIIDTKFYSSTVGSPFANCCFYNPEGTGDHADAKVGKNGNIWGDPLFVDPDNGDFRISAGSPCVDAGNGDFAPETDYYGQPRMDVKNVTDTGIANAERICPDIGIYEVPGMVAVPVPDLAVMSVSAPAEAVSGESITVTYVVTNRGKAILTGTIRDIVRFRGVDAALGGQVVAAEAVSQTYSLSVGGACAEVSATVNVPALKPGNWVVSVMVNAERDIYEGISANNTADALGETRISSLSFEAGGIQTVSVASHSTAVAAVNGLSAAGGAIVAMLPAGVSFYAAVGYVPSIGQSDVIGTALADGRTALFLPPHQADELVYVTLVNESGEKVDIQLEALISSEGLEVSKPSDVEITEKGPNVIASLILPSSIRDGRIYAAYVEYSNTGDKDADMPIFTVKRTSGNAKFSASSKGAFSAEALNLVGLAPSAPRGKLKPGESGRITFYILTSGTLGVSLDMVTEKSTSVLNGFESISAYCAGMSAAATRLCARDGVEPGFTEILAQALNEKRGVGGAAVSGTLRHLITRMPLSDYMIALMATNDNSIVSAVKTDKNGAFSLSTSESGDYALTIIGVQNYETPIYSLSDADVNGETIYAVPHSSLSGMAYIDGSLEPVARVKVTLDNVATEKIEDYVVETLDDGRYVFNGIVDGDYILSAYPVQSWCMVTSTVFTVTNGVSYSKNICYTEKGVKVRGIVTDIDTGLSVTNVLVALTLEDGSDPIGATSDGDGNFEIEGLPAGKYTLAVASDRYVLDGLPTVDISGESDITLPVSVRTKPVFSVMRPVGMVSHTTAFVLLGSVSSPEWDFDGDGIVDSKELQPTYTYTVAGKYDVKLSYVDDNGVRRTCIAADGVEVLDKFENKLTSNGVVLTAGCGVTVENVSTNSLVLVGSIAGNYKVGTVIGMESGTQGGFIRKIISIRSVSGNRYEFEVEPASLDDLFDEYFYSTDFSFTEAQVAYALRASMAKVMTKSVTAPTGNRHDIDIGVTIDKFDPVTITIGGSGTSLTHYSDPVAGSQICYRRNGKKVEVYSVKNSYVAKIPISVAVELASREKKLKKAKRLFNWNGCANGPGFWGPWGLYFSIDCDYGVEGSVTAEGAISGDFSLTALSINEIRRENDKKETNKVIDRSFSDAGFSVKSLSGTLSAEVDAYVIVGVYASWLKAIGRIGGGVKVGMTFGAEQDLAYDFGENILDGEFSSTFRLTSSLYGTIAGSASLLRVRDAKKLAGEIPWRLEWQGSAELGKIGFTTSGDDLTVNFGCKNPQMEAAGFLLGWLDGIEIGTAGHVWSFGDMSFGTGANVTHKYAEEGEYTVRMGAVCAFPSSFLSLSPFAKTTSAKVRVYDDRPPEPQEPTDQGRQNPKQSCDPNEMNGPEGVGEQRFVKPGDWMTYTVYFENKAEADVPAQEVYVTNPLSPYLDWSTFEMMDVAFGNQVESGLTGKKNGTITVVQNGTEDQVQINVALDQTKGEAKWYLRSWSPNRSDYNYWPEDGAGFLPPNNPETHCGEGHLTYRIKLRDDAPAGLVITNSATIVFDYNEPITTDPAWWNTIAKTVDVDCDGGLTLDDLVVGLPFGELSNPEPREGYIFEGWYTGKNGTGIRVTADTIVTADMISLYPHWTCVTYTIRYLNTKDAENTNPGSFTIEDEIAFAPLSDVEGWKFTGWQPASISRGSTGAVTVTAQWSEIKPELGKGDYRVAGDELVGTAPENAASVYDGYIYLDNVVMGTIQAKVSKPKLNKKLGVTTAKTSVAIQLTGEKKITLKGELDLDIGEFIATDKKSDRTLTLKFGLDGIYGTFGKYEIDGVRNFFSSKDKDEKSAAEEILEPYLGGYSMICDGGILSVTIAKKGKATVKGTYNGEKVSAKAQALIGEEMICIPVIYSKKSVNLAFTIWLPIDGGNAEIIGLDGAVIGKAGTLVNGAKFNIEGDITELIPDAIEVIKGYAVLPDGESVSDSGKKWVVADGVKAAKVTYKKGDPEPDIAPGKKGQEIANASGLKLTYKSKDGSFTGSFTVYAIEKNKLKKHKATVAGVLIDGIGYGTATIKKIGTWAIAIK